ncbi:hypothetical protein KCP76_22645 [Salmonella enterica subsp. enterica serovar Weltevreden]|nr:hypothetical protein KCP76_22645 [Salmonella enterica subsp. enterica serovar Weltevreden]
MLWGLPVPLTLNAIRRGASSGLSIPATIRSRLLTRLGDRADYLVGIFFRQRSRYFSVEFGR